MLKCLKFKVNIIEVKDILNKKLHSIKTDLSIINRGLKLIPSYLSKNYIFLKILVSSSRIISSYLSIYMSGRIITLLSEKVAYDIIIQNVLLAVFSIFLFDFISRISNRKCLIILNSCWYKHEALLSKKTLSLNYAKAGSPEVSALRAKISENSRTNNTGVIWLADTLSTIISDIFSLVIALVMVSGLFKITSPKRFDKLSIFINSSYATIVISIIVFILIVITIYMNGKNIKQIFSFNNIKNSTFPLLEYYSEKILNENEAGKDIRIFDESNLILDEIKKNIINPIKSSRKQILRSEMSFGIPGTIMAAILSGVVYLFIGLKAISGVLSAGKVVEYFGALTKLLQTITSIITQIGYIKYNNMYLKQELDFLELETDMSYGQLKIDDIDLNNLEFEFHNVSFKYPNCNNYAVKNISMKITPKEHLAIVGTNGSGKTTLINLLCRLYDPTEGLITVNGLDIRQFQLQEYLKLFSAVFQDFKLLAFPIGENIAGSEIYNDNIVWNCLEKVGLKEYVFSLPKKLKQPIYKLYEKDGIDLSAGEGQKIAIARALYKNAPFIILDEPTASLDPVSENEIYTKFNKLISNKTAIYISHRLSSCQFCDRILVFHSGELLQEGTHQELLSDIKGYYYKLWNAQAEYYN